MCLISMVIGINVNNCCIIWSIENVSELIFINNDKLIGLQAVWENWKKHDEGLS